MRKLLWCSCLTGAVVAASWVWSGWYVYKHPQSPLGRCAALGLQFGMRCNPLMNGVATTTFDLAKLTGQEDAAVAQTNVIEIKFDEECPDEGEPLVELHGGVETLPAPVPAIVIDDEDLNCLPGLIVSSKEPPLAGSHECAEPPTVTVYQPAPPKRLMPRCQDDDETQAQMPCPVDAEKECPIQSFFNGVSQMDRDRIGSRYYEEEWPSQSWFSLCWQGLQSLWSGSEEAAVSDKTWLEAWYGYFSSPSTLDLSGDEELSEPPADTNSDPSDYHPSYHDSGCPYSGACPYTGRMYEPPTPAPKQADSAEQSEPKKNQPLKESRKPIKLPAWWSGETEDSENKPIPHPEVDTMEFRPSDHGWDDYGPPSQL